MAPQISATSLANGLISWSGFAVTYGIISIAIIICSHRLNQGKKTIRALVVCLVGHLTFGGVAFYIGANATREWVLSNAGCVRVLALLFVVTLLSCWILGISYRQLISFGKKR
jgi:hypothetical protein